MRRLFFLFPLFLFPFFLCFAQPLSLTDSLWRFQTGDDPAWSEAAFDDAAWKSVPIGIGWEEVLQQPYDGMGWYRRTITIPGRFRTDAQANGGLVLHLGKIDDADETFFNGVRIGGLGQFPPGKATAWDQPRKYLVPLELVRWDQPNLLAVRVNDTGGGGGLYGGEYGLEPVSWKELTPITVWNADAANEFADGTPIAIRAGLENRSRQHLTGELSCVIRTFTGDSVTQKTLEVRLVKDGSERFSFAFRPLPPGFYIAHLALKGPGGYILTERNGFAVAPERLTYETSRPPDFEAYWNAAKAELALVKPDFRMTLQPGRSTAEVEVFLVEMRSLGGVRIKGYYTRPKNKTSLPAMLHVQGYASVMEPYDLVEGDFAQFFLNIRGHGNSTDDVHPAFPGYLQTGIESKNTYIYRGAYMDCLRAVDFLCSRPEVDTARIGVMGGSQGGALSVASAALDRRIKLCLPDVPFLSNFRQYFQVARWPYNEFDQYVRQAGRSWDQVYSVLDYIDIKNLAPLVTCPVLMGVGLFDDVCPPAINFAMFNLLNTKNKKYYLYSNSGHSLPPSHGAYRQEWMRAFLGN